MAMTLSAAPSKTRQVADRIEADIRTGVLSAGTKMLGMRSLAKKFNVSFAVINSAYDILEKKGLLVRNPRSGVIVSPDIKPVKSMLIAVLTSYGRHDIEDYYEPLLEISAKRRVVPMIGVINQKNNWRRTIKDMLERSPDVVILDVEASLFPIEELEKLTESLPCCFCNRWEWKRDCPERGVFVDYANAYAEALTFFCKNGHERILIGLNRRCPHPFQLKAFAQAKAKSGFSEKDSRLLFLSLEELRENPESVCQAINGFQPTAFLGTSDFLIVQFEKHCLGTSKMERIGFFNTHHSRRPGLEFSSFKIDFKQVWDMAVSSFEEKAEVKMVNPILISRHSGELSNVFI